MFPFPIFSIRDLRNFKVNANAPADTPPACCDHLIHEIPKLNQKAVIVKLAHQSSHYRLAVSTSLPANHFQTLNNKWSVNYERPHKQGRTAFQLHWVGSRRSQCPIAAKTACWRSHKQLVLPTPSSSSAAIQSFVWKRKFGHKCVSAWKKDIKKIIDYISCIMISILWINLLMAKAFVKHFYESGAC